jgi:hypothetical protein
MTSIACDQGSIQRTEAIMQRYKKTVVRLASLLLATAIPDYLIKKT